jgi:hypothetical protein
MGSLGWCGAAARGHATSVCSHGFRDGFELGPDYHVVGHFSAERDWTESGHGRALGGPIEPPSRGPVGPPRSFLSAVGFGVVFG